MLLLHERGRDPVAYFPIADITPDVLQRADRVTAHEELGKTSWHAVTAGEETTARVAAEVGSVSGLLPFESDQVEVYLDGERQHPEPGQLVVAHGIDRGLDPDEILTRVGDQPVTAVRPWRHVH